MRTFFNNMHWPTVGAGHMANMDKPLTVTFEILKFLLIVTRGHTGVEQLVLEP